MQPGQRLRQASVACEIVADGGSWSGSGWSGSKPETGKGWPACALTARAHMSLTALRKAERADAVDARLGLAPLPQPATSATTAPIARRVRAKRSDAGIMAASVARGREPRHRPGPAW